MRQCAVTEEDEYFGHGLILPWPLPARRRALISCVPRPAAARRPSSAAGAGARTVRTGQFVVDKSARWDDSTAGWTEGAVASIGGGRAQVAADLEKSSGRPTAICGDAVCLPQRRTRERRAYKASGVSHGAQRFHRPRPSLSSLTTINTARLVLHSLLLFP